MKRKTLTSRQVLARMKAGDCPTLKGGYVDTSVFDDGAVANHQTMVRLFRKGKIERPEGTSIYSRWKLADKDLVRSGLSDQEGMKMYLLILVHKDKEAKRFIYSEFGMPRIFSSVNEAKNHGVATYGDNPESVSFEYFDMNAR